MTDTQADLTERARSLRVASKIVISFGEGRRSLDWLKDIIAAALQSEREAAAAEARRVERKLIAEWLDRNGHHDIADTLMRNASPPAPQEETR